MSIETKNASVAPWASRSLSSSVANRAKATLEQPTDNVPRRHGNVRLTNVAHQFFAYWLEARGDKLMPSPDDIRPSRFRQLLPYVRYLHWEGDKLIHRLWGSALTEATGFDLTGTDMFDFVRSVNRKRDIANLRLLHSQPCGLVVVASRRREEDRQFTDSEMTYFPVANPDGSSMRLIGTIQLREPMDEVDFVREVAQSEVGPTPIPVKAGSFIDVGAGIPFEDYPTD